MPPTGRSLIHRHTAYLIAFGYVLVLILAVAAKATPGHAPAAWVHGTFATCVRLRESHDGQDPNAYGNLYGVKGTDGRYGWAHGVPRWRQDYIAWQLYVRYGVQPWRPYDGC